MDSYKVSMNNSISRAIFLRVKHMYYRSEHQMEKIRNRLDKNKTTDIIKEKESIKETT
jgi:hypothetical protein